MCVCVCVCVEGGERGEGRGGEGQDLTWMDCAKIQSKIVAVSYRKQISFYHIFCVQSLFDVPYHRASRLGHMCTK